MRILFGNVVTYSMVIILVWYLNFLGKNCLVTFTYYSAEPYYPSFHLIQFLELIL